MLTLGFQIRGREQSELPLQILLQIPGFRHLLKPIPILLNITSILILFYKNHLDTDLENCSKIDNYNSSNLL